MTPEVAEKIVTAIRAGAYAEIAATYAGVSRSTYFLWMAKGRKDAEDREAGDYPTIDESHSHEWTEEGGRCWCGHTRYSDFLDRIKEAEASAEIHAVGKVRSAFDTDWKAAMTYLERRYPSRWRRRTTVDVGMENEGGVDLDGGTEEGQGAKERLAHVLAALDRAGQMPQEGDPGAEGTTGQA
jgi:hypothetical protein